MGIVGDRYGGVVSQDAVVGNFLRLSVPFFGGENKR